MHASADKHNNYIAQAQGSAIPKQAQGSASQGDLSSPLTRTVAKMIAGPSEFDEPAAGARPACRPMHCCWPKFCRRSSASPASTTRCLPARMRIRIPGNNKHTQSKALTKVTMCEGERLFDKTKCNAGEGLCMWWCYSNVTSLIPHNVVGNSGLYTVEPQAKGSVNTRLSSSYCYCKPHCIIHTGY